MAAAKAPAPLSGGRRWNLGFCSSKGERPRSAIFSEIDHHLIVTVMI